MKASILVLFGVIAGTSALPGNYVEVRFDGTIARVDQGEKNIGEKIKGSFRYDIHAERTFVSHNPTQANFSAYPVAIVLDGKSIDYPYGSHMHLVDWSSLGSQDFTIFSDGYKSDGNTNVRISCEFAGSSIFGSALSLPIPPDFSNLTKSSFSYSVSLPGDPNSYAEKFSGSIDEVSIVVHPETPQVLILDHDEFGMTVHFYGKLQHSYDLKKWTNSAVIFGSPYTYPFFEGPPKAFFVRATE